MRLLIYTNREGEQLFVSFSPADMPADSIEQLLSDIRKKLFPGERCELLEQGFSATGDIVELRALLMGLLQRKRERVRVETGMVTFG